MAMTFDTFPFAISWITVEWCCSKKLILNICIDDVPTHRPKLQSERIHIAKNGMVTCNIVACTASFMNEN